MGDRATKSDAIAREVLAAFKRIGIGHNGGPLLKDWALDDKPANDWSYYCWRRAHARAWKTPPCEIALRRLRRAEELGMTYREYTAIFLDTGKLL
jgi:hypothetical protein